MVRCTVPLCVLAFQVKTGLHESGALLQRLWGGEYMKASRIVGVIVAVPITGALLVFGGVFALKEMSFISASANDPLAPDEAGPRGSHCRIRGYYLTKLTQLPEKRHGR